jgi:hypothetical protein
MSLIKIKYKNKINSGDEKLLYLRCTNISKQK